MVKGSKYRKNKRSKSIGKVKKKSWSLLNKILNIESKNGLK